MTLRIAVTFEDGMRSAVRRRVRGGAFGVERLVRKAVRAVFEAEAVADATLSLTLVGDDAIGALNAEYLGHDGPTDVIAFPLFEPGEAPVGDVYLGFEQALRHAAELGIAADEELARLAVHGTLHVLGHDHPEGGARMDSAMWRLQEQILEGVIAI